MIIQEYGIVSVSREDAIHFTQKQGFDHLDESKILSYSFPLGYPSNEVYLLTKLEDKHFLSVLNEKIGSIINVDSLDVNPITVLSYLKNSPPNTSKQVTVNPTDKVNLDIIKFENLRTLLFSFFAQKRIVMIGTQDQVVTTLKVLYDLTPKSFYMKNTFCTQSTSLNEHVNILGIPRTSDVLKRLDTISHTVDCIVDIDSRSCSGVEECDLLRDLEEHIFNDNQTEFFDSVNKIFEFANKVKGMNDTSEVRRFVTTELGHKISKSDADLLLFINNDNQINLFDKILWGL